MPPDCPFCAIAAGRLEVPPGLVLDEPDTLAFLDSHPVFPGHVLVIPRPHHATLLDLPTDVVGTLFGAVQRVAAAVVSGMGAQGTFVAVNNVVSQSVPHLHVHVVPRTKGDGLRGFFWPRTSYPSLADATGVADRIRNAL